MSVSERNVRVVNPPLEIPERKKKERERERRG
jgi:hypothetical protein